MSAVTGDQEANKPQNLTVAKVKEENMKKGIIAFLAVLLFAGAVYADGVCAREKMIRVK